MVDIFEEIVKIRSEGGRGALATVASAMGSTPRKEGSKMLVRSDGTILGSIGGGGIEAQVCQEAMNIIKEGKSKMLQFDLTGKEAAKGGSICGGNMEVFLEPILPEPSLYIFGGGHISFFIAKIGLQMILSFPCILAPQGLGIANLNGFAINPEIDRS